MNGHLATSTYTERLQAFRQADREREAMITELVRACEQLQMKYDQKCDDYDNEVESRRLWHDKAKKSDAALNEHKHAVSSNPFVFVILDGDGAIFQDSWLATGKEGGAEAAHLLLNEIRDNLRTAYPESNVGDWSIIVQVVLNMQGLANKLHACQVISHFNELTAFGRAFGIAQPLFSFIDVGNGKERADHKVRETLRLFLPMANCKHMFFGPCHDNGYLPVLESYKRDTVASKITLIETTPAEPGFVDLNFRRARFPNIFRSQNLPQKPTAYPKSSPPQTIAMPVHTKSISAISPPPNAPPKRANSENVVPKSVSPAPSSTSGDTSWATVGKTASNAKTINVASKKHINRRYLVLNAYNERVDESLPRIDPSAEARFYERLKVYGKCCNHYHLLGKCEAGEYCDYQHGEPLSQGEQLVLKYKARSLRCSMGSDCRDFNCLSGHHCKFASGCPLPQCRFTDTHGADIEPAKKHFEGGSEEWLQGYLDKQKVRM